MGSSVDTSALEAALGKLGLAAGQVVQEFGYDSDTDDDLRFAIEDLTGADLEDEGYGDVADHALVWFRDDDQEDLVDLVVDAMTNLADGGTILLMTPKSGQPGHVDPSDISDAARTSGLTTSGKSTVSPTWAVTKLVSPQGVRR